MPIFQLSEEIIFPPVELSDESGILAVGGDLSPERLILAYESGIFPWFNEGEPIIWWSPDPRFILFPEDIVITGSMRRVLNQKRFIIKYDTCFREVMTNCGMPRHGQKGTWITNSMLEAYCELHGLGFAHSIEAWQGNNLAGGLYGVSIGHAFFGESMFSRESNASKMALITLAVRLKELGFKFIDSQVYTKHLDSMGAIDIPREEYLSLLKVSLKYETIRGNWKLFSEK